MKKEIHDLIQIHLIHNRQQAYCVLTLNRSPVDALSVDCLDELHNNLNKRNLDNIVKAVILTSGSSKFFVSEEFSMR